MLPKITVIIPTRPQTGAAAFAALREARYPAGRLEILIVEGQCPPRQRNLAARQASGDIFYFLDDDSLVAPDTLRRLADHFRSPHVHLVGGPSLAPADGPFLSRCIGDVLGTRLGAWTMRARYAPVGACRPAGEKELIGCNLSVRREVFWALGGFREDLFPNEETELIARSRQRGAMALYDPALVVWRTHRRSLPALAQQFFCYGRGRMRQTLRAASEHGPWVFWPVAGLAYLASIPLWWAGVGPWALLPIALYAALIAATSLSLALARRAWAACLLLPVLFGSIHTCYAGGLLYEALASLAAALRSAVHRQPGNLPGSRSAILTAEPSSGHKPV